MVSFVKLQICINMTIFYRLSQKVALMLVGIGCNIAFLGHPCVCIAITPFIFRWQCQLILTVETKSFGTRYCPVREEVSYRESQMYPGCQSCWRWNWRQTKADPTSSGWPKKVFLSRIFFASYADLIKIVLFVARKWRVQDNLADECVGALCAKYLCPQRPKRVQKVWTSCYQRKYLRWTDFIMKWVLLELSFFFASF